VETVSPGKLAMTKVTLHPNIEWTGPTPDSAQLQQLHHAAHEGCFIANSVKTDVTID
jgi:organic hydroperoxide reductase OsmC/OhrA